MKQKPATRRIHVFKAMSRKGSDEVLAYILQNENVTFEDLKTLLKESNLRCVLRLLMKAKLVKTRKKPDNKKYRLYELADESLVIDLLEIV